MSRPPQARSETGPPPHLTPSELGRRPRFMGLLPARAQRELAVAGALLPTVLADLSAGPEPDSRDWVARSGHWTSTGTAVFALGPADEPPAAIVRLSRIAEHRFVRESAALAVLSAAPLQDSTRSLLPVRLAQGRVGQLAYVVDRRLPGTGGDALLDQPIWPAVQDSALDAIGDLHRATATTLLLTEDALRNWVDEPLSVLAGILRRLPGITSGARLRRLREVLVDALLGRTVQASWVHGDFWAGNLLVDAESGRVTGIVDWDLAAGLELPLHDPLHLLLFRRRARSGQDLGDVISNLLTDREPWQPDERRVLAEASWCLPGEVPSLRVLLLLHWLRHTAAVSVQQRDYVAHSVRGWELRNVHKVLRAL